MQSSLWNPHATMAQVMSARGRCHLSFPSESSVSLPDLRGWKKSNGRKMQVNHELWLSSSLCWARQRGPVRSWQGEIPVPHSPGKPSSLRPSQTPPPCPTARLRRRQVSSFHFLSSGLRSMENRGGAQQEHLWSEGSLLLCR